MKRAPRPSFIVGIGGSAGGLTAYKALLDALPPTTGMAFVIVAHLYPSATSQLAALLARHTDMSVSVASAAMQIRANHVYVIPPNADLLVDGRVFKVVTPRTQRNVQVDLFFTSLADAIGPAAVGIVVSGYDGDGTAGCKHIKAKGGTTFAQDMSAEVNLMPRSAQVGGFVDFVLPPHRIADQLQKMVKKLKEPAK